MVRKPKITVFFRIGKENAHPGFIEMKKHPPEGIKYILPETTGKNKKKKSIKSFMRGFLWNKYKRIFPSAIPIKIDKKSIDIIHSTGHVMILNRSPWVVEVSEFGQLISFNLEKKNSPFYMFMLKQILLSKHCKKIISWSEASRESFKPYIKESNILNKIEVVYPSFPLPKLKKRKKSDKINLLFVSRRFYEKGGVEAIGVFKKLRKKYNISFTIISKIPREIREKYGEEKGLNLLEANFNKKELGEFYQNANIFFYPTLIEIFGIVFIETMAYGLPVVSTSIFASPEIVEDGKTGFLSSLPISWHGSHKELIWDDHADYLKAITKHPKKKFMNSLYSNLSRLIENPALLKKMSKTAREEVRNGKFSVSLRNKKLNKIYSDALKK